MLILQLMYIDNYSSQQQFLFHWKLHCKSFYTYAIHFGKQLAKETVIVMALIRKIIRQVCLGRIIIIMH